MKLKINYRKEKWEKYKLLETKNMLLKSQQLNDKTEEEIRKYLEANENKSTSFQILWDAAKAVQGGKFIVMQAYIKKQEKSQQPNQV